MWGIGSHTAAKLNGLGIYSIEELAHADVNKLKKKFGVMGEQLYYHAWGIDYSDLEKSTCRVPTIKATATPKY